MSFNQSYSRLPQHNQVTRFSQHLSILLSSHITVRGQRASQALYSCSTSTAFHFDTVIFCFLLRKKLVRLLKFIPSRGQVTVVKYNGATRRGEPISFVLIVMQESTQHNGDCNPMAQSRVAVILRHRPAGLVRRAAEIRIKVGGYCALVRWSFTAQFPTYWFKWSRPRPFFPVVAHWLTFPTPSLMQHQAQR